MAEPLPAGQGDVPPDVPVSAWDVEWQFWENTKFKCQCPDCPYMAVAKTFWASQCEHIGSPYLMCAHHLYTILKDDVLAQKGKMNIVCAGCKKKVRLLQVTALVISP